MPEKKFTWENLRECDFEDIVREAEKGSIEAQAEFRGSIQTLIAFAKRRDKSSVSTEAETALQVIENDFLTLKLILRFVQSLREGIMLLEEKVEEISIYLEDAEIRLQRLEGNAEFLKENV